MVGQQRVGMLGDANHLGPVHGDEQGLACREVPVEGADRDAGLAGDLLQRGVRAPAREGGCGRRQEPVAVALRVGAQGAVGHGGSKLVERAT
ncbi:hypothetical protein GCM10018954_085470 [Kutzneria kofuensis]